MMLVLNKKFYSCREKKLVGLLNSFCHSVFSRRGLGFFCLAACDSSSLYLSLSSRRHRSRTFKTNRQKRNRDSYYDVVGNQLGHTHTGQTIKKTSLGQLALKAAETAAPARTKISAGSTLKRMHTGTNPATKYLAPLIIFISICLYFFC